MAREVKSRRRGKVLEAAIFEVVLQELVDAGYVNFSIERVAAGAGTSKPVIYRRWPTRARLVRAALRADRPVLSSEAPDTGTVRGDVFAVVRRFSEMAAELSPEVVFGLVSELLHEGDSSLFAEVHERSVKIMMEILTRGAGRGEIAAEKLTPRLAALPIDLARHQLVLLLQPLSAQDIEEIVDRIFLPLVRADRAGGAELDRRRQCDGRRSHTTLVRSALMRMEDSNMKSDEPSRTALIPARQRAAHQLLDHGSILDDPFAMKILDEDEKDVLQFANQHPLASIGRLLTVARGRIAEDALSGAVERGIRQIVILGAGLDTFALRNPHAARQVRVFEVDHPATQAWKRQRLAEAQLALPSWLVFAPVDFERDNLREKLSGAGFQQNSAAFFTWLGVVPYLTQDAIDSTLDYMASIQNSEVVFDYMEPPEAFPEEMREIAKERAAQLEKTDERWVSRFAPAGIAAILRSHGFCDIEDISFEEIVSRFGRAIQGLAPVDAGFHVVHAKR